MRIPGVVESRPAFHADLQDASNRGDAPYELETVTVARDCSASGHEFGELGRAMRSEPAQWQRSPTQQQRLPKVYELTPPELTELHLTPPMVQYIGLQRISQQLASHCTTRTVGSGSTMLLKKSPA